MSPYIFEEKLLALSEEYKAQYQQAKPFPHIYFDDFFDSQVLNKVLAEFSDLEKDPNSRRYKNPNEKGKIATSGESYFGNQSKSLLYYLNSEPFLIFLQKLTGIKETLLSDPYLVGGGFHQTKKDGFLKVHVDFHKHIKTNLDRRLNVLIYLNKNWKEEFGGHLELWTKDMSRVAVRIAPHFNRLAIFSTTDYSWHGHPSPLNCPTTTSRKSIALYYYTNGRPHEEINPKAEGRTTTTFVSRHGEDSASMSIFNTFVNIVQDITPPILFRAMKMRRKK